LFDTVIDGHFAPFRCARDIELKSSILLSSDFPIFLSKTNFVNA